MIVKKILRNLATLLVLSVAIVFALVMANTLRPDQALGTALRTTLGPGFVLTVPATISNTLTVTQGTTTVYFTETSSADLQGVLRNSSATCNGAICINDAQGVVVTGPVTATLGMSMPFITVTTHAEVDGSANVDGALTAGTMSSPYVTATSELQSDGTLVIAGASTLDTVQGTYITATSHLEADATANVDGALSAGTISSPYVTGTTHIESDGTANVDGALTAGTASAPYVTATTNLESSGTANIVGAMTAGTASAPYVTATTGLRSDGSLSVAGAATAGSASASYVTATSSLLESGVFEAQGTIQNTGTSCNGVVCVGDYAVVTGLLTATLGVSSPYITGTTHVEVDGTANVDGALTAGQSSAGYVTATTHAEVDGTANVDGALTAGTVSSPYVTATTNLESSGSANVVGALTAGQIMASYITGTLHIEADGTINIDGALTAGTASAPYVTATTGLRSDGSLSVAGSSALAGLTATYFTPTQVISLPQGLSSAVTATVANARLGVAGLFINPSASAGITLTGTYAGAQDGYLEIQDSRGIAGRFGVDSTSIRLGGMTNHPLYLGTNNDADMVVIGTDGSVDLKTSGTIKNSGASQGGSLYVNDNLWASGSITTTNGGGGIKTDYITGTVGIRSDGSLSVAGAATANALSAVYITATGTISATGDITAGGGFMVPYCFQNTYIDTAGNFTLFRCSSLTTVTDTQMPSAGSLMKLVARSDSLALTGTVYLTPTINYVASAPVVSFDAATTQGGYATAAKDANAFAAGDIVGVIGTASADWMTGTVKIIVDLIVEQ